MIPHNLVHIEYLTLDVGDPVYDEYGEYIGSVTEVSSFVRVGARKYSIDEIELLYTPLKNFYTHHPENPQEQEESLQKQKTPKKILTNEEIYEMLISDVALLGLSKKAVRKIEKAVLAKIRQGENK